MTTKCLVCGDDMCASLTSAGSQKRWAVSSDGAGFTCSDDCREVHRVKDTDKPDTICDPTTNVPTFLDLPDQFLPYGLVPTGL